MDRKLDYHPNQPTIGECPVILLNSPFEVTVNVFSKLFAISCE